MPEIGEHTDASWIPSTQWGSYLCFTRGNWRDGLAVLARANDDELREIAQADLAVGDDPQEMLEVAKQWTDFGESQDEGIRSRGAKVAARYWYERAIKNLKGVEKLRAKAAAEQLSLPPSVPSREWPVTLK